MGRVPARLEPGQQSLLDFGGDVRVRLDDPIVQVMTEPAGLGDLWGAVGERWLVLLAAEHPATAVSRAAVNSAEVASRTLGGEADLGFVEGPSVPTGLDSRVVARDELMLVVPRQHPWARRRRPVAAAELAATRLVTREPSSGTRMALESAMSAWGTLGCHHWSCPRPARSSLR